MQPPNEAPVTIFAIIVCWFMDLTMCEVCPIKSGMTTERSEIPDQVGDDCFISLPPAKRGDQREVFSI